MGNGRSRQLGFTYLAVMFAVAFIGVALAGTAEVWSQSRQREKEKQLLWIGNQFREAIGLYYQRTPGVAKRYPESLEELLEDKRYVNIQRYLRRIYQDPVTGKTNWGTVLAAEGGVKGVYSLSDKKPMKVAGFRAEETDFEKAHRYSDWRFIYDPPGTGRYMPLSAQNQFPERSSGILVGVQ